MKRTKNGNFKMSKAEFVEAVSAGAERAIELELERQIENLVKELLVVRTDDENFGNLEKIEIKIIATHAEKVIKNDRSKTA